MIGQKSENEASLIQEIKALKTRMEALESLLLVQNPPEYMFENEQ